MANTKDAINEGKVANTFVRLVEALGAALDSTKSPVFLCTAFCTLQKLLALTLNPSTTFRELDFLAFDLLNLKKYLDSCKIVREDPKFARWRALTAPARCWGCPAQIKTSRRR